MFMYVPSTMAQTLVYPPAPKWEDYIPEKYQNPRQDFSKGSSIAELSVGVVLTELIVTAPIGVPLICHSTTKLKHIYTAKKKVKFEEGLRHAQTIQDPAEREEYYKQLLKKCNMTEAKRQKLAKKRGSK